MSIARDGRHLREQRESRTMWGFLREPTPTNGTARLFEQKRTIDALATNEGQCISRYVVCSGGMLNERCGSKQIDMVIDEVRSTGMRLTLVIAAASVLGRRKGVRNDTIAALHRTGIAIKDPTGELHPGPVTLALACSDAPAGRTVRKPRRMRSGLHV